MSSVHAISQSQFDRVFNRSSKAKQAFLKLQRDAKELAPLVWDEGMDLLKKIHLECADALDKIWAAPDADDFIKETIVPLTNLATLDEEMGLSMKANREYDSQASRIKAKQELRELASGAKL